VPLGITHASGPRLAVAVFPEGPEEGREVGGVAGWDLGGGCQMLQAVRLDDPWRVTCEDVSNPGLLSTGEHGAPILAEGLGLYKDSV